LYTLPSHPEVYPVVHTLHTLRYTLVVYHTPEIYPGGVYPVLNPEVYPGVIPSSQS